MTTMRAAERFASELLCAHDVTCCAQRDTRADDEASAEPTLVFPRRGVFRWRSASATAIAEPNTVLLFDQRQPHRITHPTDDGDDCTAVRLSSELARETFGDMPQSRYWILNAAQQTAIHLALQRVRQPADALDAQEAAMAILNMLAGTRFAALRPHAAVEHVRERIAADPSERASLADLARGSGLSAYELARRFRATTGSSIHQYRLRMRLLVALSRISDGEDDLSALAFDTGFSSHAHLTSAFTRLFGVPPRRYRARSHDVRRMR